MAVLHLGNITAVCSCERNPGLLCRKDHKCGCFDAFILRKEREKRGKECFLNDLKISVGLNLYRRRGLWVVNRWRLNATEVPVVESGDKNAHTRTTIVEIPVTCYQILGVPDQAEKDQIVKSVMHLKHAEVEEGYTMDAVVCRQNLLMDVRDKLLFEPEYAGNIREKVPPKSSFRLPLAWLPGALCLLQEVGEEKLVLEIGRKALQHPDAKPYIHDILLSMALAECAIAKVGFEKNNISQGFEALARAQCLLRSKISLGKMTLLAQIEESLEELAPACTLDLLGMSHTPENAERRLGAVAALRELLRQGLDVETPCHVQDWACFLNQALNKLMATEIAELLPWENLAATRKNKKSLESQNQRVVIDFNCFYMVLIAHIALGFSSKQTDLINKAKGICDSLIASEGIDLKFEEAFCMFLLGQGGEAEAAEKLRQLELNSSATSRYQSGEKETRNASSAKESLGKMAARTESVALQANYFVGEKKAPVNMQKKRASEATPSINHRPISPALASDRSAFDELASLRNSSRYLGPAVKQLTPSDVQGPLLVENTNSNGNVDMAPYQLKRNLGTSNGKVWETWFSPGIGRTIIVTILGFAFYASYKLMGRQLWKMRNSTRLALGGYRMESTSLYKIKDSSLNQRPGPAFIGGQGIAVKLKELMLMLKMQPPKNPEVAGLQTSGFAVGLSSSNEAMYKRPMPVEEAESLVKQWQAIKAEALGPNHQVASLFEVLDESMLSQWEALAETAKARTCFWRFVLLQMLILRADIFSDVIGKEMAEIEVLVEEAAELVDESLPKNPNYYSNYKIHYVLKRQEDGSWKFCDANVQSP